MKQKSGTGTGYPVPVFMHMGVQVKYVSKLTNARLRVPADAERPSDSGTVLLLPPPEIREDGRRQAGDEKESRVQPEEDGTVQRKEGDENGDQTRGKETFASQAVCLAPDFLAGDRPGRLDAHIKVAAEFRHRVSDKEE